MPPAARVSDMHACPMVTGLVPHVGGPVLPPGCPTVLIGNLPAARATDMATCAGGPDSILMGSPTVLIGNMMAARVGDPTTHGGAIVLGCPTVMIGDVGLGTPAVVTPIPPLVLLAQAMQKPGATEREASNPANAALALARGANDASAFVSLDDSHGVAPVIDSAKKSWIEIELVDQDGEPVPYELYNVRLPEGSSVQGCLDEKGLGRIEGIDSGTCQISFPNRDAKDWKRA
jgi:uncharacterized Zn-binding protein involved in type VI secretion